MLAGAAVGLSVTGHVLGGGHVEPVLIGLLLGAVLLGSHAWLRKERGLLGIVGVVVGVQIATHLMLTLGHSHRPTVAMFLTHAGAAIVLAVFLRVGEARLHAAARRRLTWLLVATRIADAASPRLLPAGAVISYEPLALTSLTTARANPRRGPPTAP